MAENVDDKKLIQITGEVDKWLVGLKLVDEETYNSVLLRIKSGEVKKW